jgi:predicted aldo/keto reductase-like oxidoreductase
MEAIVDVGRNFDDMKKKGPLITDETKIKDTFYKLKKILWKNQTVNIVLQNENGPCPLIAIANVLSLRNEIFLPQDMNSVTFEYLVTLILEAILKRNQNVDIEKLYEILPKLQSGMIVNVGFGN